MGNEEEEEEEEGVVEGKAHEKASKTKDAAAIGNEFLPGTKQKLQDSSPGAAAGGEMIDL